MQSRSVLEKGRQREERIPKRPVREIKYRGENLELNPNWALKCSFTGVPKEEFVYVTGPGVIPKAWKC